MTGLSGFLLGRPRSALGGSSLGHRVCEKRRGKSVLYAAVFAARAALASALLMGGGGCVLPYWELAVEPPDVNSIPIILPESVVPQLTRTPVEASLGRGCQYRTFSATAIDYDGAEQLHYKWILTASIEVNANERIGRTYELVEGTASQSEIPIDTIVPGLSEHAPFATAYKDFSLDLTRERLLAFLDVERLATEDGDHHRLEVWVSDRPFEPGVAVTTPQTPPGQPPQPAAYVAWSLKLLTTDCDGGLP